MTLDLLVYQISRTGQARTDQGRPGHTMTDQERQGQTKSDMVRPGQTRAYQDKTRHTRNTWNTLIFWKSWNTRNTCFCLCLPTWEKFPHFPVFFLVEDVPQQCCQYFLLWWYLQKNSRLLAIFTHRTDPFEGNFSPGLCRGAASL